ncbi:hypothetical protein [Brevundimonas subvibrioides]|uniref:hypothetical protein n=1 Tax=Brevundimonas subvibrioides TaxID=74313 RepID=UPI0012EADD14|nr:hypothetical protein [Brevundimonas subvibrioides]
MRTRLIVCLLVALTGVTSHSAAQSSPSADEVRISGSQLRGLAPEEAQSLIAKLVEAQQNLRQGRLAYFDLLSGAPASYETNATAPMETFLAADFTEPFSVQRFPEENASWKPYRLILTPNGLGQAVWQVEVVLGFYEQIERVEMFYRPPPPH